MRLSRRLQLYVCLAGVVLVTLWARAVRFVRRVVLACRFYFNLGYSWHLAWIKAERSEP